MTIEQRARFLYQELENFDLDSDPDEVIKIIKDALKAQDKITRHACAESLLAIPRSRAVNTSEYNVIELEKAQQACMNSKQD